MSHRITYESKITDRELAMEASKSVGMNCLEGDRGILSLSLEGRRSSATLNLSNGKIVVDSDHYSNDEINAFKIAYTEASVKQDLWRRGASITSRQVVTHNGIPGVVLLKCSRAVG